MAPGWQEVGYPRRFPGLLSGIGGFQGSFQGYPGIGLEGTLGANLNHSSWGNGTLFWEARPGVARAPLGGSQGNPQDLRKAGRSFGNWWSGLETGFPFNSPGFKGRAGKKPGLFGFFKLWGPKFPLGKKGGFSFGLGGGKHFSTPFLGGLGERPRVFPHSKGGLGGEEIKGPRVQETKKRPLGPETFLLGPKGNLVWGQVPFGGGKLPGFPVRNGRPPNWVFLPNWPLGDT